MSNKRNMPTHQQAHLQLQQTYSGPIPPAEQMKQYADIDQSFPQKIMDMAMKEQQHRFEKERAEQNRADELIKINSLLTKCGIFSAVLCVSIIMTAAVLCAVVKQPIAAGIIGAGGLAIIVTVLVKGSRLTSNK